MNLVSEKLCTSEWIVCVFSWKLFAAKFVFVVVNVGSLHKSSIGGSICRNEHDNGMSTNPDISTAVFVTARVSQIRGIISLRKHIILVFLEFFQVVN